MSTTARIAIVTGAGTGVGRAAALALLRAEFRVVLAGRRPEPLENVKKEAGKNGANALCVPANVADPESVKALFAKTKEAFGRLDVLFNNAGVIFREKTVPATSVEEWDATFEINTRGTFLMSKAALEVMIEQGGGVIINNASYFGLVGGRGTAAYSASKGAVVLLTKAMALDHASNGIRVNCVCAGSVDTPMLQGEMEEMGGEAAVRHLFEDKHPLGRIASPHEIAQAVLYLASDDAAFVTGAALPIDGGLTAG